MSLASQNSTFVTLKNQEASVRSQIGTSRDVIRGHREQRAILMQNLRLNRATPGGIAGFSESNAWTSVVNLDNLVEAQNTIIRDLRGILVENLKQQRSLRAQIKDPMTVTLNGINVMGDVVYTGTLQHMLVSVSA